MKVVINRCYGGFSLSPLAVERMAELQGRSCYFYHNTKDHSSGINLRSFERVTREQAENDWVWYAMDVPDAIERQLLGRDHNVFRDATPEQRQQWNDEWEQHCLDDRPDNRHDPILVQVVEELGERSFGQHAELEVVEIPDGTDYEIDEYDGMEHIAERHRTWP